MAWDPRYQASLAIISYVGAGFLEEVLKYLALQFATWRAYPIFEREYLTYALAAGLDSIAENLSIIRGGIFDGDSRALIALKLFERLTFGTIGHLTTAFLIAIQSIRREARGEKLSIWLVLAKPVLYHGMWDFRLLLMNARHGNVGFDHPAKFGSLRRAWIIMNIMQGLAVWDVLRQLKRLKLKDCSFERDSEKA